MTADRVPARPPSPRALASALLVPIVLALAPACGEEGQVSGPDPDVDDVRRVGVVLNSVDISLTLFTVFPDDSPGATSTIGLGPAGSPVGFSVQGRLVAVPMGTVPAVALVDLLEEEVSETIALPEGSGATGSAFANDSILVVANPNRNSVSPVNYRRGTVGPEIPVGTFPEEVVPVGDRLYVLNSELGADFQPAGPGTITVLRAGDLSVAGTIELSGRNPVGGALGPDGRLYVVNSGAFGEGDGSLSVVDPVAADEVAHHGGFGEFPGAPAFGFFGLLHVPSFAYGLAIWEPASGSFSRSPADPLTPGGVPSVSGVAFDDEGRLYTLLPRCSEPGAALRLDQSREVAREIPVGTCPIRIAFTNLPG